MPGIVLQPAGRYSMLIAQLLLIMGCGRVEANSEAASFGTDIAPPDHQLVADVEVFGIDAELADDGTSTGTDAGWIRGTGVQDCGPAPPCQLWLAGSGCTPANDPTKPGCCDPGQPIDSCSSAFFGDCSLPYCNVKHAGGWYSCGYVCVRSCCATNLDCEDLNPCTVDKCEPKYCGSCVHTTKANCSP